MNELEPKITSVMQLNPRYLQSSRKDDIPPAAVARLELPLPGVSWAAWFRVVLYLGTHPGRHRKNHKTKQNKKEDPNHDGKTTIPRFNVGLSQPLSPSSFCITINLTNQGWNVPEILCMLPDPQSTLWASPCGSHSDYSGHDHPVPVLPVPNSYSTWSDVNYLNQVFSKLICSEMFSIPIPQSQT